MKETKQKINNSKLFTHLKSLQHRYRYVGAHKEGSPEIRFMFRKYYQKIYNSSILIREVPTFMFHGNNKDGEYYLLECNLKGGVRISYYVYDKFETKLERD